MTEFECAELSPIKLIQVQIPIESEEITKGPQLEGPQLGGGIGADREKTNQHRQKTTAKRKRTKKKKGKKREETRKGREKKWTGGTARQTICWYSVARRFITLVYKAHYMWRQEIDGPARGRPTGRSRMPMPCAFIQFKSGVPLWPVLPSFPSNFTGHKADGIHIYIHTHTHIYIYTGLFKFRVGYR